MRRFFLILSTAFFLFCAGCGIGGKPMRGEMMEFRFTCKADIQCPEGKLSCSFQRMGPQNVSLTVLSGGPDGLGFNWNGDGFTMTYQGLAATGEACVLPENSFARILVEILDSAEKKGALTPTHGNEYSGNCNGVDYLLTADSETDYIQSLSVPDKNLQADFYDYDQKTLSVYKEKEPVTE